MTRLALYSTVDSDHAGYLKGDYALFVAACGSDLRAYRGLRLVHKRTKIRDALLFEFSERTRSVIHSNDGRRYREYEPILPVKSVLDCSLADRTCAARDIATAVSSLKKEDRVLIDLSVFTKPYFFALLKALQLLTELDSVDILYTEPAYYPKTRSARWAAAPRRFDVVELPGYAGKSYEGRKRLLVIILGFDGGESRWVYDDQAATVTVPINGFPSYLLYYKDVSIIENAAIFKDPSVWNNIEFAPANDPFGTFNALETVRRRFPEDNYVMTIAPLGTKPMALGAGLFALYHPEVRVVFPLPSRYPAKMGNDVGRTWLYDVPIRPFT